MSKIIEYTVVGTEEAQDLIDTGWQPYGSAFYNQIQSQIWQAPYMQPMVRYEEEPTASQVVSYWVNNNDGKKVRI